MTDKRIANEYAKHLLDGNTKTTACGLTDAELASRPWTTDRNDVSCHWCREALEIYVKYEAEVSRSRLTGPRVCAKCGKSTYMVICSCEAEEKKPTGTKRDRDKTRFDLIPHEFEESLARVLTFGAQTYGPNNWRMMEDLGRFVAAYRRHVNAWQKGEILDPETNEPHLVHAICNLMFLCEIQRNGARQAAIIHDMSGKEKS